MESPVEAPVQSITVDVTALNVTNSIRTKRKRCEGLKPVLRGSLRKAENGKIIWSGCWGLTREPYTSEFPTSVKKAPFYFERKKIVSNPANADLTSDGYFQGYFSMQDLSKPHSKTVTFAKYHERNILLRFRKIEKNERSKNENLFSVVGSGENKFGKFLIEGTLDTSSGEINVCRNYLPKVKKVCVASPRSRQKRTSAPRRSSRDRTPTLKLKESYINVDSHKTVKDFDFVGREDIITLLDEAIERLKPSSKGCEAVKKLKSDLEAKLIKSLRSAKIRSSSIMDRLPMSSWLMNLRKRVSAVSSRRRHIKSSQDDEGEGGDEEPQGDYVSVFESYEEVEELDPLSFDIAAELPKKMSSPKLIELSSCFADLDDEYNGVIERKEDELYPIEVLEKVDFSDLSYLDAETLKQLNEFVEFSCPSKGQ